MHIIKFQASDVNGYLNFDISFDKRLNFLVGINGSGKTSVLKLVIGLLTPSINNLSFISFSFISLTCVDSEGVYFAIIAECKGDDNIDIYFKTQKKTEVDSFPKLNSNTTSEAIREKNNLTKNIFDSLSVVELIKKVNTPYFLGLDRRALEHNKMQEERRKRMLMNKYYDDSSSVARNIASMSSDSLSRSLFDVQELIFDYFRRIASEQPKITEDLKNKIFDILFVFYDSNISNALDNNSVTRMIYDFESSRALVTSSIKELGMSGIEERIHSFYSRMEEVANTLKRTSNILTKKDISRSKREKLSEEFAEAWQEWNNNMPQLQKVQSIIGFSQEYQARVDDLRGPIKKLEVIMNNFYSEANKFLEVRGDGQIDIILPNGTRSNIFDLSSGEKQIFIMIANLIFSKIDNSIFIIDEPELSLHIAWQEIFVDSIISANPNTQFILATHSPSIIANTEREVFCKDLTRLN